MQTVPTLPVLAAVVAQVTPTSPVLGPLLGAIGLAALCTGAVMAVVVAVRRRLAHRPPPRRVRTESPNIVMESPARPPTTRAA